MSETITKIVVGTDFNALAACALRFAGLIAARTDAEVVAVYADVFDGPTEFTAAQVPYIASAIEHSQKKAREQLEVHVQKEMPPGVRWRAIVLNGEPARSIAELADAQGADFIALGTHGRGGIQRMMVGSVAEAVMREAHVPVLTLRSTSVTKTVARVLCPVNGSDVALDAARFAARLSRAIGAELTLLHVATPDERSFDASPFVALERPKAVFEERKVEDEHPSPEILRIAESGEYDLIVIGAEHRIARDFTIFGTTTASVTRHSRTPVLTVTHALVMARQP